MKSSKRGLGGLLLLPLLMCTSTLRAEDSQAPAPPNDVSRQDGSLSKKLDATSGVIHPEGDVDPGMQKTPPATGAARVLPPPGTPGGRSDVLPK